MRTKNEKIQKFISEYQTNIERCDTEIKDLKEDIKAERSKLNGTLDAVEFLDQTLNIEAGRKQLAVQEKKHQILVQARTDFETLLD